MRRLQRTLTASPTAALHAALLVALPGDAPPGARMRFDDVASATAFLRRYLGDALSVRAMRAALEDAMPGAVVGALDDADVVARLATAIARGRVAIVRGPEPRLGPVDAGAEDGAPAESEPPPPARELYWIAFRLVDWDGSPVAGERFRAVLSDGRVETGRLDGDGYVAWHDVAAPGRCTISFPEIDATWDAPAARAEAS
jgi:hypothetical protein